MKSLLFLLAILPFILVSIATIAHSPTRHALADILRGTNIVCDKFYSDNSLQNIYGKESYDKYYSSYEEAIREFPWIGQYFFKSPGEPYCILNLDGRFSNHMRWESYKPGYTSEFMTFNIEEQLKKFPENTYTLLNSLGFILLEESNMGYKILGFYGYTSVP
jgi:hypothetical protein